MKRFFLALFMLVISSAVLRAEAVSFEATVNSAHVSFDETIQLTLTVTGINDNIDPVSLPVIDGFSAKYLGPSTSVSIVNGDYHSEKSFIYELYPNKTGKFQIPPISATFSGKTYSTKPIDLEVVQHSDQPQASDGATDQNQTSSTDSLKDKILMMVTVDKHDVYLNEKIPLSVKLLVNGVPVRDIQYPQFDKSAFTMDDYDKPEQGSQEVNGIKYDTVEFKTNIYPNHLGDVTLGPVQIQGNVLYKNHQQAPFNEDTNPFGAEVFNGFFDTYSSRPITVTSNPIQLHVSALPNQNRPSDFSGAIGQFDFQASVSPLQVKAGDPITLKMEIKGEGNFKSLKMPAFYADGFKTYSPQIKGAGFEKTAEEVIIPTSAAVKQVPVIQFSYFDTSLKDYRTLTQGPFDIKVMAPSADQDFKAIGFTDVSRDSSMLPANQFSWVKLIHQFQQLMKKVFASIWFWISFGFIVVASFSYYLWRKYQERLENDPAFARRLKAVREAKQALIPAEGYIQAGQTKDFYALIAKVLRDYLANKWHQSAATLSIEKIQANLKSAKIEEALIVQIKTLLEQSDLVCFAGASVDYNKMRVHLSQTQELLSYLERLLR